MTTNIEKTYSKKTHLEHILLRPDSYIGSTNLIKEKTWIYDDNTNKIVQKDIELIPGLFKIFDEILVNAVDNLYRDRRQKYIKVNINKSKNEISVENDGKGIPIHIHGEHKIYIPEMIFGHLLTSSNFNDSEKKTIGGRNGYGAKLANIFSSKFIIETVDMSKRLHYIQTFQKNMTIREQPIITDIKGNEYTTDFTKVTFYPDLKLFKLSSLTDDIISHFKKRVYDISGTTPFSLKVFYNNSEIQVKSFEKYVDLYLKDEFFDKEKTIEMPKIFDFSCERWEVGITMSDYFNQVSFVNNVCTSKGGTHINHVLDQIVDNLIDHIKKKNKGINLKPAMIKNHLFIFVNCKIENPTFDSQTKENMTLEQKFFGSKCELSDKFYKQIYNSMIVKNIVSNVKAKESIKLNKTLSSGSKKSVRLLGISKLEDANLAGTNHSKDCTLILCEGDSAKALVMAGLEVVGRDYYGVFPLKGKLLNVRDATSNALMNNEEIQNVIKIIGLQIGKDYSENISTLRYGKMMIMTDQDPDGSHIKGLIINFISNFWPSLIIGNKFVFELVTPLVKVTLPGNNVKCFYSTNDFKNYYNQLVNGKEVNMEKVKIKYYKGLGTSTSSEAKEYFKNMQMNRIMFQYVDEKDIDYISMIFSKQRVPERKAWLNNIDLSISVDYSKKSLRYLDFINQELIFYSFMDNSRSIPSLIDGLKPSERKIIYSCFKRKLVSEIKVAQLAGYVSEHSAYHHGEASLCQTITALAQDFVGSNNLNLLTPVGQFGNRYLGGKGAASPRYIFTHLNKLSRYLFIESDDNILTYNVDDGQKIEPLYYIPILPSILINGCEGIGTGWSTSIPCYNPIDIANNFILKLDGNDFQNNMTPWYRGFKGKIIEADKKSTTKQNNTKLKLKEENQNQESEINSSQVGNKTSFIINGIYELDNQNESVIITELPIKTTITGYKEFLEENYLENKTKADKPFEVLDIKEYHSENNVLFKIKLSSESYSKISKQDHNNLMKTLKLTSVVNLTNMVAFDSNNKIKKYENVKEIMDEFYNKRIETYKLRKRNLISKLQYQKEIIESKYKFVNYILKGELNFINKGKKEIISILKSKGLKSESQIKNSHKDAFLSFIVNDELFTEKSENKKSQDEIEEDNDFLVSGLNNNSSNVNLENNSKSSNKISSGSDDSKDYDYLMGMNIWTLTSEKVELLKKQLDNLTEQLNTLMSTSEKQMWKNDIMAFKNEYLKIIDAIDNEKSEFLSKNLTMAKNQNSTSKAKNPKKNQNGKSTKPKSKKKNEDSFLEDDDDSESSFEESNDDYYDESSSIKKTIVKNGNKKNGENTSKEKVISRNNNNKNNKTESDSKSKLKTTENKNTNDNNKNIKQNTAVNTNKSTKVLTPEEIKNLPLSERVKYNQQLAANKTVTNLDNDSIIELLDSNFEDQIIKPKSNVNSNKKDSNFLGKKNKNVIDDSM